MQEYAAPPERHRKAQSNGSTSTVARTIIAVTCLAALISLMNPLAVSQADTEDHSPVRIANFRDIAGPDNGYPVPGGTMARGSIFRSSYLGFNDDQLNYVAGLGIVEVFDLRTSRELEHKPDVALPGAVYRHIDVIGDSAAAPVLALAADPSRLTSPAQTMATAQSIYRDFVSGQQQRNAYHDLLAGIADANGPVIIHCTAGKDRTGWATALLLHLAGVSDADIMSNYMLTNEYSKESIDASVEAITRDHGPAAAAAFLPYLTVDPSYLNAALNEAQRDYGSLDAYITQGLRITPAVQSLLRARLVQRAA